MVELSDWQEDKLGNLDVPISTVVQILTEIRDLLEINKTKPTVVSTPYHEIVTALHVLRVSAEDNIEKMLKAEEVQLIYRVLKTAARRNYGL